MPAIESLPAPGRGRRTLAIRAGALGDTIVAIPALDALRRRSTRLEVVGTAPYVELVPADRTHSIDRAAFRALFDDDADDTELMELARPFDTVVVWSAAPSIAGKLPGADVLQTAPLPPEGVHASDHLMGSLKPLGIAGPAPPPRIEPSGDTSAFPAKFIALHPGSGSLRKNWPAEHFEAVARRAHDAGLSIVWIEGEADADVVGTLAPKVPGTVARDLALGELAAVLARAAVYVGNDSGVSHLAAAVGAPTVAVFVATDPARWAPRGPRVRVAPAGSSPVSVWGFARDLMSGR